MESLKRKPDLGVRRSMELPDGTKIELIGITGRKSMQIVNNQKLSDAERGMHMLAAKILVNGSPIVYDDLLDKFTDEEIVLIGEFINSPEGSEKNV